MKKILTVILSIILILSSLSMFGCGGDGNNNENTNNNSGSSAGGSNVTVSANGKAKTDVSFKETDIDLVKDGTTQYSIVVPENPAKFVQFAADELQALFLKSTGITLNIIPENMSMTTTGHYLSLGETVLQEQAGTKAPRTGKKNPYFILQSDTQIMGDEGAFAIERKDNTVIMVGIDDYGTVFAAYEFLEKQLGYKYYAADEVHIDNVVNEKLIDINWSYTPFAMRNHATDRMGTDEASLRYYMIQRKSELYFPHSWLSVLPYSEYGSAHPDWYGASGKALCLANAEMAKEYGRRVLQLFDETGYATHCAGQPDDWAKCECGNCQVSDGKYLASGTNVIFVNRVCAEIDRLLAEQGRPDFRYRIVMLAYYQYEAPPAVKSGNKYVPLAPEVKFHPNAGVHLCLFGAGDAAAPLTGTGSAVNEGAVAQIKGWLACNPDIFEMYLYRGYFPLYNLAFPFDWDNLKNWIVEAKAFGSAYNVWSVPAQSQFEPMRAYLHGQLCYDPTQNANDLIDEFMEVYYKDAAPIVQQFFEEITSYMYMKNAQNPSFNLPTLSSGAGHLLDSPDNWTEEMLADWVDLFDSAYEAVEKADISETQRDVLEVRVDDESLWPRYWLIKYYGTKHFTSDVYAIKRQEVLNDAYRAGYVEGGILAQLDK